MAKSLSLTQPNSFQLSPNETLFCKSLVVGDTVAAYTATLAILQAGGQVCWVQPGKLELADYLNQGEAALAQRTRFNWRLGRRATPWETAVVLSQSQQRFWDQWQPQAALPTASTTGAKDNSQHSQSSDSKRAQLRQAIAPYLSNQKLILITQADPIRVLYAEHHQQRRLYQVVFRDRRTQQRFQIQAKLTLDATRSGILQQQLTGTPRTFPTTALVLTTEHIQPKPSQARGTFFEDAIALIIAEPLAGGGPLRPISIPLRALVPEQTEGFLCISQPGCETALQPLFQQPQAQWTLGEVAGHIAAKVVDAKDRLLDLLEQPTWRWQLQHQLIQHGIPLFAFDDVPLDDPDFEAIQMGAIADVVRTMRLRDLSFRPEVPVTRSVVASALSRLPGQDLDVPTLTTGPAFQDVSRNHWAASAIQRAIAIGVMTAEIPGSFAPSKVLSKRQLWEILSSFYPAGGLPPFALEHAPARRRDLSRGLYPIFKARLKL